MTDQTVRPRFAPAELPPRMRGLPLDHRGFPVPWFVAWLDGDGRITHQDDPEATPDFRVVDTRKFVRAVRERRCWLCGQPLGRFLAFVIGPMCAVNRINSEPPSHRECALFGMRACPFLSQPRMRRNAHELPEGMNPAAGFHLEHNPGAMCLWTALTFRPVEAQHGERGILFELGEPTTVEWFCEGRSATPGEIQAALAKGLPSLRAVAELQGGDSPLYLDRQLEAFYALQPALRPEGST